MTRPWISTNLAVSIDGKIAPAGRRPCTWTSDADHHRLLDLRRGADALLVGRRTLEVDRMTLTVPDAPRQPLRCIASRSGTIPPDHPVFSAPGGPIHLMVAPGREAPDLPGATVHAASLPDFLEILARHHGVTRLHCEGGGDLIRALAELDAIDEYHLTLAAHTLFSGAEAITPTGHADAHLPAARLFELVRIEPLPGLNECFLSYRRNRECPVQ